MSAAQAYRDAGYVDNRRNASALKTNKDVIARVLELQKEQQDRFILTRQCVLDGLLENIEKALGRRPVKIGEEGKEIYVYRGDVANNALKMAGQEIGLFRDKAEITHRTQYDDLSDVELVRMMQEEATLLLEHVKAQQAGDSDGNAE